VPVFVLVANGKINASMVRVEWVWITINPLDFSFGFGFVRSQPIRAFSIVGPKTFSKDLALFVGANVSFSWGTVGVTENMLVQGFVALGSATN
jgi:hypothetical protein